MCCMIKKKKYFKTKAFSGHMLGIKIQDLGFFIIIIWIISPI